MWILGFKVVLLVFRVKAIRVEVLVFRLGKNVVKVDCIV